jgi:hypothetical protein
MDLDLGRALDGFLKGARHGYRVIVKQLRAQLAIPPLYRRLAKELGSQASTLGFADGYAPSSSPEIMMNYTGLRRERWGGAVSS